MEVKGFYIRVFFSNNSSSTRPIRRVFSKEYGLYRITMIEYLSQSIPIRTCWRIAKCERSSIPFCCSEFYYPTSSPLFFAPDSKVSSSLLSSVWSKALLKGSRKVISASSRTVSLQFLVPTVRRTTPRLHTGVEQHIAAHLLKGRFLFDPSGVLPCRPLRYIPFELLSFYCSLVLGADM